MKLEKSQAQQAKLRTEFPKMFKLNLGLYYKDFRSGFKRPNKKIKKAFNI